MDATTTICLDPNVKNKLNELKLYNNESYNSVVERLIKNVFDEETLTAEEIKGIENSLVDIKEGRVYNEEQTKKMLGISD